MKSTFLKLLKKRPQSLVWIIILFALLTRIYNLGYPSNYYFDEVYNAFTTLEFVKGNSQAYEWFHKAPEGLAYGWTHPPLAKLIAATGVLVFGPNPFGWRIANVLIGVGVVYLVYLLSKELFLKRKGLPLTAALLASLDGLLLVQSRINMNDIVATFFILLSFYHFIQSKYQDFNNKSLIKLGFVLGFTLATKWTAIYVIGLFGVWVGIDRLIKFRSSNKFRTFRSRFGSLFVLVFSFMAIPVYIYILSYLQYFILGGTWANFVELQNQMWWYNTSLTATHIYGSAWWSWPIMLRPVYYFVERIGSTVGNIYAMGNPVIWWGGIVGLLYVGSELIRSEAKRKTLFAEPEKRWKLLLVVLGYLIFWFPWAMAPRVMFIYHYLPSIPFMIIALSYLLTKIPKKISFAFLIFAFVFFIYFFPHWTGLQVPQWLDNSYYWIPTWK